MPQRRVLGKSQRFSHWSGQIGQWGPSTELLGRAVAPIARWQGVKEQSSSEKDEIAGAVIAAF